MGPRSLIRWAVPAGSSVESPAGPSVDLGALLVVLAVLSLAVPAPATTQEGLDSVAALAAAGRTEEARAELETWWDSERSRSSRRDRQRGLWLRAVLTVDPGMAILDYQRLVVEYPGGPYSDKALARLARIAGSDADVLRAAGHFRTLLQDYPQSAARVGARRWLATHSEEIEAAEAAAALEAEGAAQRAGADAGDSAVVLEEPPPPGPDSAVRDPAEEEQDRQGEPGAQGRGRSRLGHRLSRMPPRRRKLRPRGSGDTPSSSGRSPRRRAPSGSRRSGPGKALRLAWCAYEGIHFSESG